MDIKLTKTGDDAYTLKIDSICIENADKRRKQ